MLIIQKSVDGTFEIQIIDANGKLVNESGF